MWDRLAQLSRGVHAPRLPLLSYVAMYCDIAFKTKRSVKFITYRILRYDGSGVEPAGYLARGRVISLVRASP
jgi:hypothetical protein